MKKKQIDVEIYSSFGTGRGTCELISYDKSDAVFRGAVPVAIGSSSLSFIFAAMGLTQTVWLGALSGAGVGLVWGYKIFKNFEKKTTVRNGQSECKKCSQSLNFSFNKLSVAMEGLCPRCATHYKVILTQSKLA